jgi:hypothetical protein
MKKSTVILILMGVTVVFFASLAFIVRTEAVTLKPSPLADKEWNCRIVNTALAIDNSSDILLIGRIALTDNRHIMAIDKKGKLYDISIGENLENNETLEHYLQKNNMYVYGTINTQSSLYQLVEEFISSQGSDEEKDLMIVDNLYFYFFRMFYDKQETRILKNG